MRLYRSTPGGSVQPCPARRAPAPPQRIYAVGDVHGRLDLLAQLMAAIRRDSERRGEAPTTVILLGDLVDRGPAAASLVAWAMASSQASDRLIVLKGNHEALMTAALDGDREALALWLGQGGRETLLSWGLSDDDLAEPDGRLLARARRAVGKDVTAWLAALPVMALADRYLFVHAGIRPGVPIERQREDDLLWIRSKFVTSDADHGAIVVHGHSEVAGGPERHANRIAIDTAAYRTGCLTALGLEGDAMWFLDTRGRATADYPAAPVPLRAAG